MSDSQTEATSLIPSVELQNPDLPEGQHELAPADLKRRTAHGALASSASQAATFGVRTVSTMVLARLLTPEDFGLVGMVTAVTGFMSRFKEAGLSDAAVQSASVNQAQLSMLFWINVALGCGLGLICAVSAHFMAVFYGQPRLFWIMIAGGSSFVFTGLAAQHRAVLLRNLRMKMLAGIDIASLVVSVVVSIVMAATGFGYWALIASTIIFPACGALGVWLAAGWIPSWPQRNSGVKGMLLYGGTVTLNSMVVYLAYNVEKVLLGRFWGAEVLGVYGRAYSLVSLPSESLHTTLGSVAFPALSRLQREPERFRHYFLRMYSLFLSISLPITISCAVFAEDIVRVFLGPQWHEAVGVFRLLAPTILAFAMINPFGWLLFANGRVARSLKIALLIAPITILSYVLGLKHGPTGVAVGFSTAMILLILPVIVWSRKDTLITTLDAFRTSSQPVASAVVGAVVVLMLGPWVNRIPWPLLRLTVGCSILFSIYLWLLLFVFGQRRIYVPLLRQTGLWPSWLPQPKVKET